MQELTYTDEQGRMWWVQLPPGVPESEAHLGIPIGPPPVDALGLPVELATRLHNELYLRRIFTYAEAVKRQGDVQSAVRSALRLDTERVIALYSDRDILSQGGGRNST